MKKIFTLFIFSLLVVITPFQVQGSGTFRLNETVKETEYIDGVRHQFVQGVVSYNGVDSDQQINYLGADITKDDFAIITADNYTDIGWGKGTLQDLIYNIERDYPNYEVIGGVNGDFFGTSGIPIEAYIRNYHVISAGLGNNRTVIGFKDDGSVVYNRPDFDGYEMKVYNEFDEVKDTRKIDAINMDSDGVSVYFDNHTGSIPIGKNKVVVNTVESHRDDWGNTYYEKGLYQSSTTNGLSQVDAGTYVLTGTTLNEDLLIEETDYVVIQKSLTGDWEDVRFAIGGWARLVTDGVVTETFTEGAGPTYRHPRTAIGIKEDGTVFFVVVDGRDYSNGYLGMTHYELSELMVHYGAVDAFNVDGGGSSAMILKQEDGTYDYVNTPSDGSPRPVTNGMFIVRGQHEEEKVAIWPDNRIQLDNIENIILRRTGYISFDEVENAVEYQITVNGEIYSTELPEFQIETPGTYSVQIEAIADGINYKNAMITEMIEFEVFSQNMNELLDYFMNKKED